MSKRRTKIILICALLFSALLVWGAQNPLRVSAEDAVAKVGETNYNTFSEALAAWNDNDTLFLLKDTTLSDEMQTIRINGKKTLDLMGFTLGGVSLRRTIWIEEGASLTVRDNANTGKITGGGIRVEGELILESGTLTQNTVGDDGGGVYVLAGGKFTMTGGKISQNVADGRGGGVFCEGECVLGGTAQIVENVGKDEIESNLYLPAGNRIELRDDFSGRAGVALSTAEGTVADGFKEGLFADDKLYETRRSEGQTEIRLSPLFTVEATYSGEQRLFPSTAPTLLFEHLSVRYLNKNGVEYPQSLIKSRSLKVIRGEERAEEFSVGENLVEARITGRDGETATAVFSVNVEAPALLEVKVLYTQNRIFRFDSEASLEALGEDLSVSGVYEDMRERRIFASPEETSERNGGYISDYFELSGSFTEVLNGKATMKVSVPHGESAFECEFSVNITKYTLYTSEIPVHQVKIPYGAGERSLAASDFVTELPEGAAARARMENGEEPNPSALEPGIYGVEIEFYSENEEKYEIMGPAKQARLLVYAPSYEGISGNMHYIVTCEGGISPEWSFSIKQTDPKIYLRSGLSAGYIVELTFFPWESEDIPSLFTVQIFPEKQIAEKKSLYLFRVNEDGSTEGYSFLRKDGAIEFETDMLNETTYCVAVENNDKLFLILSICFVILCLGCVGAFCGYLFYRKKKNGS